MADYLVRGYLSTGQPTGAKIITAVSVSAANTAGLADPDLNSPDYCEVIQFDTDTASLGGYATQTTLAAALEVLDPSSYTTVQVNISSAATTAVVTGVALKRICIKRLSLYCVASNTVTIKSGSTSLYGSGIAFSTSTITPWETGDIVCATGEDFNITTSGSGQVSGFVTYQAITP